MLDDPFLIASIVFILTTIILAVLWTRQRAALKRYQSIRDAEQEAKRILGDAETKAKVLTDKAQQTQADAENAVEKLKDNQATLTKQIGELETHKRDIEGELEHLDDAYLIQSFGLYEPKYHFAESVKYRARLESIRQQQKQMLRNKAAAVCHIDWTVDGSRAKGRKQADDMLKLMLRAFNGESETLIMKVKFNNVTAIQDRIKKEWETINRLGKEKGCSISHSYLELKLEELFLAHEYAEKVQEEKEEQRRIREQMREEEKARLEIQKAIAESEKEEARYQKALEKARREVEQVTGEKHERLLAQIAQLEGALKEAEERHQRAESRAQMTRSGYVYIISNIGSFGDNVFKIGVTRRLEPLDRVRELGDASVPFRFDVHGMIFSEDAPALENMLHQRFKHRSVNKVNFRKEFFNVTLNEIEKAVAAEGLEIEFTKIAEAEEYRKSLVMAEMQENRHEESKSVDRFDWAQEAR